MKCEFFATKKLKINCSQIPKQFVIKFIYFRKMEKTTLTYKYEGKTWLLLLSGLFFAAAAAFFYYLAVSNDKGLIINNIISLSENGAAIFYWVLFALSMGFVLIMFVGLYFKIKNAPNHLVIDEEKIIIPPIGLRRKTTEIAFSDIESLRETKISGNDMLMIYFNGKETSIHKSLMPNKQAFEEAKAFIIQQWQNK